MFDRYGTDMAPILPILSSDMTDISNRYGTDMTDMITRYAIDMHTCIYMIYLPLKELKKKTTTCAALSPKPSNPTLDPEPNTLDPYVDMHPCICAYYIYMYLCPEL